ncbi:MAG: hypothetical protein ABSB59_18625 [Streptosporangiaceae bacterium]
MPLSASVQPPPTNSPASSRSIQRSLAGDTGALSRSSAKARWLRQMWPTFASAAPSRASSSKTCRSEAPKPPRPAGMRNVAKPASISARTCSRGKILPCSRSALPWATWSKTGWKVARRCPVSAVGGVR